MCGICGVVGVVSGETVARVEGMSKRLAHRGPDDSGLWVSPAKRAVLGHRRLSIIDLSDAGHQPMSTEDGRFTITYNGEIYNFRELRDGLKRDGVRLFSGTDTEVLLALWAREGEVCLERLHGMFAFAVWDERERRLTLVRDPFGIKPLYYAPSDGEMAFSSELEALRHGGYCRRVNWKAAWAFLQFGSIPAPLTLYEGVSALAPGTLMEFDVDSKAARLRRYWDYGRQLMEAEVRPMNRECARERIREALRTSVREHLTSDVPVGAFLSGGIDSTAVVSLMRQVGYDAIKTFSIGFEAAEYDETGYARTAAQRYGTDHREHVVTRRDFEAEREKIFSAMDQPTVDGVNSYFVSKHAAEAGMKVVTSGLGGDEFFQGYPYFRKIPRLLAAGRSCASPLLRGAAAVLSAGGDSRARRLSEFFRGRRLLRDAYLACRRLRTAAEAKDLLEGACVAGALEGNDFEGLFESVDAPVELGKRITHLEAGSYMANTLLRDSDVFSMAHGLELRLPLVYDRIAECLAHVPDRLVCPNGHPKSLLVEAVGDLPREIVDRPKMGFTFPLEMWLREGQKHRFEARSLHHARVGRVQEMFYAGRVRLAEYWSLVVLDQFLARVGA